MRATSYGSLKTEEKTERQCGQFEAGPRVGWVELSVNFAVGHPAGGNTDTGRSTSHASGRVVAIGHTAGRCTIHQHDSAEVQRSLTLRSGSRDRFGGGVGRTRFCWRV